MEAKIERQLGKGSFATVLLLNIKCPKKENNQVAVKLMESSNQSEREKMLQEMDIMKDLDHKHIVKYYTGYLHKEKVLLLLEYCSDKDLSEYLQARKPSNYLTEQQVYKFACQIASATVYLHKKYIIHRDIKTKNILLTKHNNMKLADFGISRQLENTLAEAGSYIGTPLYIAPEILNYELYSYKADSWSFGCCLHEMMSLHYAFKLDTEDNSQVRNKISTGQFHRLPRCFNVNLQDLVKGLLVVKVDKRLNMSDVFSFLQGMMEESVETLPPVTELPDLPDKKLVMSAIRKYNIECNQSSSSEEPDEYSDDFEPESESDSDLNDMFSSTLSAGRTTSSENTLTESSNSESYAREIATNLRQKLVCLNIDQDNDDTSERQSSKQPDSATAEFTKKRKKKSYLKDETDNEPVTLYTRSQKVVFSKQTSTENTPTTLEKLRTEIGEMKYSKVVSLMKVIKDPKLLKHQLIDIIGSTCYQQHRNLFLDSKNW